MDILRNNLKNKMAYRFFKLNNKHLETIKNQFDSTIHFSRDHYYKDVERYRRYSIVTKSTMHDKSTTHDKKWTVGRSIPFRQSGAYNNYLGDVIREYPPIYSDYVQENAFQKLLNEFYYEKNKKTEKIVFRKDHEPTIHVHCIRVKTDLNDPLSPKELAPEQMHQDGYARVGIVCVARENIIGGLTTLSEDKECENILQQFILQPGEMVVIDDKKLWHGVSSILPKNLQFDYSYRDVIVMTTHD